MKDNTIPESKYREVFDLWMQGYGDRYVANKYGVDKSVVRRIVKECGATEEDKALHMKRMEELRKQPKSGLPKIGRPFGSTKYTPPTVKKRVGVVRGPQFHRANIRLEDRPYVKPLTDEERSWIVSSRYCEGCIYYSYLGGHSGGRCCDYTFITGDASKMEKPCDCTRRKERKRRVKT